MRDKILLRQLQALPLDAKILMTQQRIREWYNFFNGNVFISFSGGKDSTVLTHLVHDMYPNVPLVFANTGLEYPEIQAFARDMGAEFVRPKMRFDEVIIQYGYPIISKEVAEAISFARRIVPIGGGTTKTDKIQTNRTARTTARRRRTELEGQRENELIQRSKVEQDGGEQTSQALPQPPPRANPKETPNGTHRNPSTWKTSKARNERRIRKIERFRKQLMGK